MEAVPVPPGEGAKFLERDFDQCFQQMRHYDAQIVDIVKFAFTAYGVIVGTALGLYRYGLERTVDFRPPAIAIVLVGLPLGVTLYALVAQNRSYFVLVARYVNEHRAFFLNGRPLGFENKTRMYTDPVQPPYFNWRSSQALLLYSLALLNAALLGLVLYLVFDGSERNWWIVGVAAAVLLLAQLVSGFVYLRSREGKSGAGFEPNGSV